MERCAVADKLGRFALSVRQRERDAAAGIRLEDAGWHVIRVRHDEDWQAIADENPSVFGQGRPRPQETQQEGSNK